MAYTYRDRLLKLTAWLFYWPLLFKFKLTRKEACYRLHVGCGTNRFPGWVNADIDPRADLVVFLERKLPFADGSLDRIYSEHVIEHVPYAVAVRFFREARRALRPGGVMRIAMPDLDELVERYRGDWRNQDWLSWPEFSFIRTRAEMINLAFRGWGHQHLYNREELVRALDEAGFRDIRFVAWGQSQHADLCGLETRKDSLLIAEAAGSR